MYEAFQTIIVIICSITLFIFGLQNFSREIESVGTHKLSLLVSKVTKLPLGGFFLGAIFTAVIQSSTLVSTLTVTLVNSGVIAFKDSIMILLGTNIGTTSTAWIVSLNSSFLGPFFIVLGSTLSMIPKKSISVIGKPIFYFGFIFFSLSFISVAMEPIKSNPYLVAVLAKASTPILGIIYGIIITIIVQSSSVVVGLVIVLLGQGTIDINAAIPIVIGANIGTTSTAMLVSMRLSSLSKLVAFASCMFNIIGVILLFPFFGLLKDIALSFSNQASLQVAIAFTLSNTFTSVFFLVFLQPTLNRLRKHHWYAQAKLGS